MSTPPPENQFLVISYLLLRKALGYIAIAMPFVVGVGAWYFERIPWAGSISAYYYTSMRDVFVGTMFTVGVFLFCYRGYDRPDNLLTNIAGAAAASIGLLPMDPEYSEVLVERHRDLASTNCYVPHGPLGFHIYVVALFFGIMSYLVMFRFTKTDEMPVTAAKRDRNRIYLVCGVTMLGCFGAIALIKWRSPSGSIFIPETGAVLAFAVAWLTKGGAIRPDQVVENSSRHDAQQGGTRV
jgi:hypothetical protein